MIYHCFIIIIIIITLASLAARKSLRSCAARLGIMLIEWLNLVTRRLSLFGLRSDAVLRSCERVCAHTNYR